VLVIPFGNGPERMIDNLDVKCQIVGLDFMRHNINHIVRASVEGVAFSFVYGAEVIMGGEMGMRVIKAGRGNLFECKLFCETISTLLLVTIEIYETNGSDGAAKAALLGYLKSTNVDDANKFTINTNKIKEYKPIE
jgi:xylulokinase